MPIILKPEEPKPESKPETLTLRSTIKMSDLLISIPESKGTLLTHFVIGTYSKT